MAHTAGLDSRPNLFLSSPTTPPHSIPKDAQGLENPIPLSPQCLMSKAGESKPGLSPGEIDVSPFSSVGNHSEGYRPPNIHGEKAQAEKKDVFRPSVLGADGHRPHRWHDEEREPNSAARKDRWRDGERDVGDTRKMDCWDLSAKQPGEQRRAPPGRWNDSTVRDSTHEQRRESKWNSNWGPDNKGPDASREKSDSGKDGDILISKGSTPLGYQKKDEGEVRPWRPSFIQGRSRGEVPPQDNPTNKFVPSSSYGRGSAEADPAKLPIGRGKTVSGGRSFSRTMLGVEKGDDDHRDPFLRYSHMKLLDIYRGMNSRSSQSLKVGLVQVPALTQDDSSEPLALCAPNSEEQVVLEGINKGEIVSSGAPQISKEGHSGRNPSSFSLSQQTKHGSREDISLDLGDVNGTPDVISGGLEMKWQQRPKPANGEWGIHPYFTDDQRQFKEDVVAKRPPSVVLDWEQEARRHLVSPPEELVLYYKDPQGEIQGPFSGGDIIGWFEAGFFGIDLLVRLAGAPSDFPFSSLGDVMPHLRAKARPPPGFNSVKLNELEDASDKPKIGSVGKIIAEADLRSEINKRESSVEAGNRFLPSLMGGSAGVGMPGGKLPFSEGGVVPSEDGGNNSYLLAQKMSLDRQRSASDNLHWLRKEAALAVPSSGIIQDRVAFHKNLQPRMVDDTLPPHAQNSDINPFIQGLRERSSSLINNNVAALGIQQQRLQSSLTNLLAQPTDILNANINPELLLSSGISQDPQVLTLLQQQYLMQVQTQPQVPSQQLSMLDKLLLLKQQQQQEEQQQMLLQQQLLLQALVQEQALREKSYNHLHHGVMPTGVAPVDPRIQPSQEMFQGGMQVPTSGMLDDRSRYFKNMPPNSTPDINRGPGTESLAFHSPQQIVDDRKGQTSLGAPVSSETNDIHHRETLPQAKLFSSPPMEDVEPSFQQVHPPPASLASIGFQSVVDIADNSFSNNATTGDVHSESVVDSEFHKAASVTLPGSLKELLLTDDVKTPQASSLDKQCLARDDSNNEHSLVPGGRSAEMWEGKKNSEKKSKKQKSSKSGVASDHAKANITASLECPKQLESEALYVSDTASEVGKGDKVSGASDPSNIIAPESQHVERKPGFGGSVDMKDDPKEVSSAASTREHFQSGKHVWKAAPGFKVNSLLEIQQEEQNKSQLHDVLAEEISVKSGQREVLSMDLKPSMSSPQVNLDQVQVVEEDHFIDSKEVKRSRKKSAKSKVAGSRVLVAISSVDAPVISSSSLEKVKKSTVQDLEILPAVPSGPSLGDFVPWKVEPTISQPSPAWSNDSGKAIKPASLRDILKEQEKKAPIQHHNQVHVPKKSESAQSSHAGSWSVASSSPSKSESPLLLNSKASSRSNSREDSDLFWGPIDQSKQEKQVGFPQLPSLGKGAKSIPTKASPGGSLSRQKPDELFLSSPPSVPSKAKKGTASKHSEAAFFRDWCEGESVRLVGSKDTSFLEYCLKQSRAEAEMLLVENLESFDPDHEFIDKFLNYMDLLSVDVIDIAFQGQNGRKAAALGAGEMTSDRTGLVRNDHQQSLAATDEQPSKGGGGGKKKGKKGKKVNLSALGFNVVSNRIMMGEIQTVDD